MTKEKFKLPKEFTEEWLIELRSGKYIQGTGSLLFSKNNVMSMCCLGVACSMVGISNNDLNYMGLPSDIDEKILLGVDFPNELTDNNELIQILTTLNDGYDDDTYDNISEVYLDTKQPLSGRARYTFPEIADWIEQNVELY